MQTAPTLSQLRDRHSAANRWLGLPGAHLWPERHAAAEAELRETWAEMKARFPAYVEAQAELAEFRKARATGLTWRAQ